MKKYKFRIETGKNEAKEGDIKILENFAVLECTFDCGNLASADKFADEVFTSWKTNSIMNPNLLYYRTELEQQ